MTQRGRTDQVRRVLDDLEREVVKWREFKELKVLVEQRLRDKRFKVSTRSLGQLVSEHRREKLEREG